jgi:bacterioferritin
MAHLFLQSPEIDKILVDFFNSPAAPILIYNLDIVLNYTRRLRMHEKSIELLNKAVSDELSAVHQYMYFHFHCEDQGYDLLAGLFFKTAIEEMGHIELCAERILFLGGDVEMVAAMEVQKIHDVKEMLTLARKMEEESAQEYNEWANECAANADSMSKKVFEGLVEEEERHYDQYDVEVQSLEKFGDRYLALQSIEHSKKISSGAEE